MNKVLSVVASILFVGSIANADQAARQARQQERMAEFAAHIENKSDAEVGFIAASNVVYLAGSCVYGAAETAIAGAADAIPVTSLVAQWVVNFFEGRRDDRSVRDADPEFAVEGEDGALERGTDVTIGGVLGTVRALGEAGLRYVHRWITGNANSDIAADLLNDLRRNWSAVELTARNSFGTDSVCANSYMRLEIILFGAQ